MSARTLSATEDDITKFLLAKTHLGVKNVNYQMTKYVSKRRSDGVNIINIHKTWEKVALAARIIVTIENPLDVCAISGRTFGQRAVLKFAKHVGATPIAGRYTPGTFTNQNSKKFLEPRLLIVTDPRSDHQPILEASYVNIPVIGFADTDCPLTHVDVAIPCNNKGRQSVALMYWLLAREVLRMKAQIARGSPWSVMVDLFMHREEEIKAEDKTIEAAAAPEVVAPSENWAAGDAASPATDSWAASPVPDGWNAPSDAAPALWGDQQ